MLRRILGALSLLLLYVPFALAQPAMFFVGACVERLDAQRIAELDKVDPNIAMQTAAKLKFDDKCTNVILLERDIDSVLKEGDVWTAPVYPYPYLNYNSSKAFSDFNTRKKLPPKQTMYLYRLPPGYANLLSINRVPK